MKKKILLMLLTILLASMTMFSLTAFGNNDLFVIQNISHTPGEYRGEIIVGSGYYVSDGVYSYDLVGKGTTGTIYTVQVRIGIYDKSNNYLGDINDIVTLKENETKTITGTCLGNKDVWFKVLKIIWN